MPETSLASHRERDLQRSFSFCITSAIKLVCVTGGKVVSVTNTYIYDFNKVKLFFLLVDLRVPRSLICIWYQDTEVVPSRGVRISVSWIPSWKVLGTVKHFQWAELGKDLD